VGANDKERIQRNVSGIMKRTTKAEIEFVSIMKKLGTEFIGDKQPFVVGETVIAVNAITGSSIINGFVYKISSVEKDKGQDGKLYWYVGVTFKGNHIGHDRIRPSIFRSLTEAEKQPYVLKLVYGDQA
jgi:hypothetical protein